MTENVPIYGRDPSLDRDPIPLPVPIDQWPEHQKIALTRAIKIDGPFKVWTSESGNEPFYCEDGYLAIDSRGYLYAIATEEFQTIYRLVADA